MDRDADYRTGLLKALEVTGRSLRSVTIEADVSYEQFKKLRQGGSRRTNAEDAEKVAAVFGLTARELAEGALPRMEGDTPSTKIPDGPTPEQREWFENLVRKIDPDQLPAVLAYIERLPLVVGSQLPDPEDRVSDDTKHQ